MFIFALLIILLSVYQAQFVPQENRQVEFQHFQEVRNDMIEIRSSISTAGETGVSQYPTIKLGTTYPVRVVALNPPPSAGTLRTSDAYNITVRNETKSANVSTRFLEYRNNYHEMDIGSLWYENSVIYLDERSNGGQIAVYADQNINRGGNASRVNALQNGFRETSTGRVTIELYPTESPNITDSWNGSVTVLIPTRLNGTEYWDESLSDFSGYNGVEEDAIEDGIHRLNITVDAESLTFNTVGVDTAPEDRGSVAQNTGMGQLSPGEETSPTTPGPSTPTFDTLTVEASDITGSGEIKKVRTSGTLSSVDRSGTIWIEFNGGQTHEAPMKGSFDFRNDTARPPPTSVAVYLELRDASDNPYQTCTSDTDLTETNDLLDLSDFTCST